MWRASCDLQERSLSLFHSLLHTHTHTGCVCQVLEEHPQVVRPGSFAINIYRCVKFPVNVTELDFVSLLTVVGVDLNGWKTSELCKEAFHRHILIHSLLPHAQFTQPGGSWAAQLSQEGTWLGDICFLDWEVTEKWDLCQKIRLFSLEIRNIQFYCSGIKYSK